MCVSGLFKILVSFFCGGVTGEIMIHCPINGHHDYHVRLDRCLPIANFLEHTNFKVGFYNELGHGLDKIFVIFRGGVCDCHTHLDQYLLYCKFGEDVNFKVDFHNELGHGLDTKWY